jgi:uncharacterized heparinase superfamily protein
MLSNVPPRQLWRRAELRVSMHLAAIWRRRVTAIPVPVRAKALPLPIFPPRRKQGSPQPNGFTLVAPWGKRDHFLPVDWKPPASSPIEASWRTRLHYMEYLEGLPTRLLEAVILDWIQSNSFDRASALRVAWHPYATSIRVVVWMQQIAARRAHLSAHLVDRASASIAEQMRVIERLYESDLRGNHLIKNVKALLWGAAFFDGAESERWRQLGQRLLSTEVADQILADGMHYERSPTYHCQVMADLLECHAVLPECRERLALATQLVKMAQAATALTHPDGKIAQFNDSAFGNAYSTAECLDALAHVAPFAQFTDGPFALREAGFFGFRLGDDYLVVDCGPIAPASLIGHGHGDILSFEWSLGGHRIFVDQGTYQYAAGRRRETSRSTASHNTVTIDNEEQCDFYGAHRCGRRAHAALIEWNATANGFILVGSHDGFAHLPGRPCHIRRFEASPGRLVIEDRLLGGRPGLARAAYLCHPACGVTVNGNEATISSARTTVQLSAPSPIRLEDAEWYPDLYVAHPTKRISFDLPWSGNGATTTLMVQK